MKINFRVWDNVESCWFGGLDRSIKADTSAMYPDIFEVSLDNSRFTIQFSTGIKDINGNYIFEGDIVKTLESNTNTSICGNLVYSNGEIKWLCSAWKICQSGIGASYLGDYVSCDCCNQEMEIIGNIFNKSK